jgi:hypothetical protein
MAFATPFGVADSSRVPGADRLKRSDCRLLERMSGNQGWRVARLHQIKRRDRDIPLREHFGISAFGVRLEVGRDWGAPAD